MAPHLRVATLAALGALAMPSGARAASEEPPGLVWRAPPSCGSRDDALQRLSRIVGAASALGVDGSVDVSRSGATLHLRVRTGPATAPRERELDAATCALATDAAVALLAMSLADPAPPHATAPEPDAPIERAPPEPAAPPRAVEHTRGPSTTTAVTAVSTPRRAHLTLAATAGLVAGPLSSPAPAVGASAAWEPTATLRFALHGEATSTQTAIATGGVGGRFSLVAIDAQACRVWGESIAVGGCVGTRATIMRGDGVGVVASREAVGAWWGPEAAVFTRVRLGRVFAVSALAVTSVPLARRRFVVDGTGTVRQPGPVDVGVAVGPEARF